MIQLFLLIICIISLGKAGTHCLTNSSLQSIVDNLSQYNCNITMDNILTLDDVVSSAYEKIPHIGGYKVEI